MIIIIIINVVKSCAA